MVNGVSMSLDAQTQDESLSLAGLWLGAPDNFLARDDVAVLIIALQCYLVEGVVNSA